MYIEGEGGGLILGKGWGGDMGPGVSVRRILSGMWCTWVIYIYIYIYIKYRSFFGSYLLFKGIWRHISVSTTWRLNKLDANLLDFVAYISVELVVESIGRVFLNERSNNPRVPSVFSGLLSCPLSCPVLR